MFKEGNTRRSSRGRRGGGYSRRGGLQNFHLSNKATPSILRSRRPEGYCTLQLLSGCSQLWRAVANPRDPSLRPLPPGYNNASRMPVFQQLIARAIPAPKGWSIASSAWQRAVSKKQFVFRLHAKGVVETALNICSTVVVSGHKTYLHGPAGPAPLPRSC